MKRFFAVAVALMTTVSINLAQAGATSNEGGPLSLGGGPPSGLGAAGIPQKGSEDVKAPKQAADPSDKGEDVSVDRDPAPRVPRVDKP
jgi:hypothetical protein